MANAAADLDVARAALRSVLFLSDENRRQPWRPITTGIKMKIPVIMKYHADHATVVLPMQRPQKMGAAVSAPASTASPLGAIRFALCERSRAVYQAAMCVAGSAALCRSSVAEALAVLDQSEEA